MCGIAGIINKNGDKVSRQTIEKMTNVMYHRGPDAGGVFINDNVSLGHRRLSIVDLSDLGNQPMESSDGNIVIVFNGEIYNYPEIKKSLESKGTSFKTNTDTEVIIESYRIWGEKCVNRFNGMWSFALYDKQKEVLFMSRDRMGVKPLYILDRQDCFAFASEIKSLVAVFPDEKIVDEIQLARYLRGIQEDSDDRTFYKNIKNFTPATNVIYNLNSGKQKQYKYWKVDQARFKEKWKSKRPDILFRKLFEDSIRIRLRADVPVGASLSGGLDSSAIVEVGRKKFNKRFHTFSSIYNSDKYGEEQFIDCVNKDTDSISHYIYPDKQPNKMQDFRDMLYYHDNPPCFASPYSGYCVYRGVGDTVTVLLDGQGADELFAGYCGLITSRIKDLLEGGLTNKLKAITTTSYCNKIWSNAEFIPDEIKLRTLGIISFKKYLTKKRKKKEKFQISPKELFDTKLLSIDIENVYEDENGIEGKFKRALYHEQFHSTLQRILHDVDRNSMSQSLEVRLPFLDYRIVEFSYSIDDDWKFRNGWTKYIIRKSLKKYMPKKIWSRRQKLGFPAPFEFWMRDSEYKDEIRKLVFDLADRGLLNRSYLRELYQKQLDGLLDEQDLFFRFMMLEMWLESEIDSENYKWKFA